MGDAEVQHHRHRARLIRETPVVTRGDMRQSQDTHRWLPHVGHPAMRLRGGAKSTRKLVYFQEDTRSCMGGRVKVVAHKNQDDDVGDAFEELIKMVNETSLRAKNPSMRAGVLERAKVTANCTGIAPRMEWWDDPETTREEVGTYIRAHDPTFPDPDDHPRLNAELASAATYGRVRAIRDLVAQGAQVNAGGAGGSRMWVPLHHAVRNRRPKAVRALLALGARVNISTWGRWSPLHFAAACPQVDGQRARAIARMLLEAGANMYAVNAHGQTPFDCLLEAEDGRTIQDVFEEFGFNKLANAAAKGSVHFRAPQMPRNKEGQLPYMDLMLGNADDFVMRHCDEENVQAPPDSVEEISDFGKVERWHKDISMNSDDDTPSGCRIT